MFLILICNNFFFIIYAFVCLFTLSLTRQFTIQIALRHAKCRYRHLFIHCICFFIVLVQDLKSRMIVVPASLDFRSHTVLSMRNAVVFLQLSISSDSILPSKNCLSEHGKKKFLYNSYVVSRVFGLLQSIGRDGEFLENLPACVM